jgi:hypothetical protein
MEELKDLMEPITPGLAKILRSLPAADPHSRTANMEGIFADVESSIKTFLCKSGPESKELTQSLYERTKKTLRKRAAMWIQSLKAGSTLSSSTAQPVGAVGTTAKGDPQAFTPGNCDWEDDGKDKEHSITVGFTPEIFCIIEDDVSGDGTGFSEEDSASKAQLTVDIGKLLKGSGLRSEHQLAVGIFLGKLITQEESNITNVVWSRPHATIYVVYWMLLALQSLDSSLAATLTPERHGGIPDWTVPSKDRTKHSTVSNQMNDEEEELTVERELLTPECERARRARCDEDVAEVPDD